MSKGHNLVPPVSGDKGNVWPDTGHIWSHSSFLNRKESERRNEHFDNTTVTFQVWEQVGFWQPLNYNTEHFSSRSLERHAFRELNCVCTRLSLQWIPFLLRQAVHKNLFSLILQSTYGRREPSVLMACTTQPSSSYYWTHMHVLPVTDMRQWCPYIDVLWQHIYEELVSPAANEGIANDFHPCFSPLQHFPSSKTGL